MQMNAIKEVVYISWLLIFRLFTFVPWHLWWKRSTLKRIACAQWENYCDTEQSAREAWWPANSETPHSIKPVRQASIMQKGRGMALRRDIDPLANIDSFHSVTKHSCYEICNSYCYVYFVAFHVSLLCILQLFFFFIRFLLFYQQFLYASSKF